VVLVALDLEVDLALGMADGPEVALEVIDGPSRLSMKPMMNVVSTSLRKPACSRT
jgi:hypothetical protein